MSKRAVTVFLFSSAGLGLVNMVNYCVEEILAMRRVVQNGIKY